MGIGIYTNQGQQSRNQANSTHFAKESPSTKCTHASCPVKYSFIVIPSIPYNPPGLPQRLRPESTFCVLQCVRWPDLLRRRPARAPFGPCDWPRQEQSDQAFRTHPEPAETTTAPLAPNPTLPDNPGLFRQPGTQIPDSNGQENLCLWIRDFPDSMRSYLQIHVTNLTTGNDIKGCQSSLSSGFSIRIHRMPTIFQPSTLQ